MNVKKILQENLVAVIQKLGIIGVISYIGGTIILIAATTVDFKTETSKAWLLMLIGTVLLLFSGVIYWLQTKEQSAVTKEAIRTVREVYNRMAEQISTADEKKTVSITMTIDNLPSKIAEVIKKTARKN